MGIWDLINKLRSASRTAVEENVVPAVNEYVHDEEGRARIARRVTSFAGNAVFRVVLRWVPGGTLLYDIVMELMERLKDEPPLPNSDENKKSKPTVTVEETQAKMEKMQEEMDTTITRQSKILMEKMQEEMNTTITQQSKILMEKMQEEMNTVKQEMNTVKQEMNTIRSRL